MTEHPGAQYLAEPPTHIRVAQDSEGFWTCREAVSGSRQYVREDLLAAEKARADAAEEECRKARIAMNGAIRANAENKATIADLTAKLQAAEALAKEEGEARDHWFDLATYEVGGVPQYWKDRAERAEAAIASLTEQLAEALETAAQIAEVNLTRAMTYKTDVGPMLHYLDGKVIREIASAIRELKPARATLSRLEKQEGEA